MPYLAELGSFGQNNVLLTPEYGSRVRFTSIFIAAEIKGDPIKIGGLCTKCLACVKKMPVNAVKKGNFPPLVDKISCAQRSKELRKEYRLPCGICIKVCPVGEDRKIFNRKNTYIYGKNKTPEKYRKA